MKLLKVATLSLILGVASNAVAEEVTTQVTEEHQHQEKTTSDKTASH